jgi:CDP-diacylglycerol--serine O-phosphatidyltransferase
VFTVMNALLGFCAVVAAFEGHLEWAYTLLVMCVLADGLDGIVARRFAKKWNLGDYLDIMADSASFGLAPAVILYISYRDGLGAPDLGLGLLAGRVIVLVAGGVLIATGVLRLARFCFERGGASKKFTGLPIPAAALMLVLALMVGLPGLVVVVLVVAASLCMVSDFPWPKPRGWPGSITGVLAVLLVAARVGSSYVDGLDALANWHAGVGLFWNQAYIALGPATVRAMYARGLLESANGPNSNPSDADGQYGAGGDDMCATAEGPSEGEPTQDDGPPGAGRI